MVYICVLNYNNPQDTISCLESLQNLIDVEYKILLVDNASTDNSLDTLKEYVNKHPNTLKLFPLTVNAGYAAGNNVALKYAMTKVDMNYCWILNNDTVVEPDSLKWLVIHMENNPDVGICGSKLIYSWDRSRVQGYGGRYRKWLSISETIKDEQEIDKMDYVIGASVFVKKDFLEDIGLMCEDYFLYFEELDWRLRSKGRYRISCESKSVVYHKEGATIGANIQQNPKDKSEIADYFDMRNRLLFTSKFYPYCLPTVYFISFVKIINRLRRKQYRRAWMFIKLLLGIYDQRYERKCL